MRRTDFYMPFILLLAAFVSCTSRSSSEEQPAEASETIIETPVTVASIMAGPLTEYVALNATSSFLQSNIIKASANGYVKSIGVAPGQFVSSGKTIFSIQTKESTNIGTIINNLDSSYQFSGITTIKASQPGYITQLNHQVGDYVQDGEQLAAISTSNSFGFVLNVPYEWRRLVTLNKAVEVDLPDGTQLKGTVASMLPAVDSVSQTQRVLIHVQPTMAIPENLVAKVKIVKTQKEHVISLPKEAVLSNESQTNFWVMKMIDSATAVKVPVVRGIETDGKVEILEPIFSQGDRVLITGNYGLADTAKVKIVKPE
jgi:multidrug efflux pump subunit AcrA (membrane-fusion protein)